MSKIPIVLITGYLGSGKTTVVNHLLGTTALAGRDVALVINEFGTLGVDGALVDADRLAKQYEINSGSLFCSCTKLQLFRSMQDIAETLRPDLVLVEATGVAEPADFLSLVSDVPNLARQFSILATLAVVDAKHFTKVAPFMRAARKQVACASGVVINKADLVPQDDIAKLQNLLAEMNSSALQVVVASGAVSMEWIESLPRPPAGNLAGVDRAPVDIFAASFQAETPLDRNAFSKTLRKYGESILRLKGNVDFGQGPVFVELAGGELLEKEAVNLSGSAGSTAFTVIAWKVSKDELAGEFGLPSNLTKDSQTP